MVRTRTGENLGDSHNIQFLSFAISLSEMFCRRRGDKRFEYLNELELGK
jgi:hypothetical protein